MYRVYVLKSKSAKKSYVGHTNDLQRRLNEHNSGKASFTKTYTPWELVHKESFQSRKEAIEQEKFLKSKSGRKFLKSVIFK